MSLEGAVDRRSTDLHLARHPPDRQPPSPEFERARDVNHDGGAPDLLALATRALHPGLRPGDDLRALLLRDPARKWRSRGRERGRPCPATIPARTQRGPRVKRSRSRTAWRLPTIDLPRRSRLQTTKTLNSPRCAASFILSNSGRFRAAALPVSSNTALISKPRARQSCTIGLLIGHGLEVGAHADEEGSATEVSGWVFWFTLLQRRQPLLNPPGRNDFSGIRAAPDASDSRAVGTPPRVRSSPDGAVGRVAWSDC